MLVSEQGIWEQWKHRSQSSAESSVDCGVCSAVGGNFLSPETPQNSSGQLSPWSVEMKICIKTVRRETYLIDVEPTDTVGALKRAIERHPEAQQYIASSQTLIFAGRILDDSSTIASLYLKENDFIVLMKRRNNAQEVRDTFSIYSIYFVLKLSFRARRLQTNILPRNVARITNL